jgi:hypothetical protein
VLRETVAISDDLVDTGIGDPRVARRAKLIEFLTLLLFGPAEKLIFEAFVANGGSRPSAGPDPGYPSPSTARTIIRAQNRITAALADSLES